MNPKQNLSTHYHGLPHVASQAYLICQRLLQTDRATVFVSAQDLDDFDHAAHEIAMIVQITVQHKGIARRERAHAAHLGKRRMPFKSLENRLRIQHAEQIVTARKLRKRNIQNGGTRAAMSTGLLIIT